MIERDEIKSEPAIFTAVVQIKRAKTGVVEEFTLTGTPVKEQDDGGDAQRDPAHNTGDGSQGRD
ncbi:MAG: hypothetical protein RJA55_1453 [Acidobacteriota bacterium]|jgi:hypothetical protein